MLAITFASGVEVVKIVAIVNVAVDRVSGAAVMVGDC